MPKRQLIKAQKAEIEESTPQIIGNKKKEELSSEQKKKKKRARLLSRTFRLEDIPLQFSAFILKGTNQQDPEANRQTKPLPTPKSLFFLTQGGYLQGDLPPFEWDLSLNIKKLNRFPWETGKRWLISYADDIDQRTDPYSAPAGPYVHAQNQNFLHYTGLLEGAFDHHILWRRAHLPPAFQKENKWILAHKQWAGLGLWKPWIINETLKKADEGDIALFMDAGLCIEGDIKKDLRALENHDIIISAFTTEKETKNRIEALVKEGCDLQEAMKFTAARVIKTDCREKAGLSEEDIRRSHYNVATIFLRNTPETREFVKRWLNFSCDPKVMSLDETRESNPHFFRVHPEEGTFMVCMFEEEKQKNMGPRFYKLTLDIGIKKTEASRGRVRDIFPWHRRIDNESMFHMPELKKNLHINLQSSPSWDVSLQPALYPQRTLPPSTMVYLASYAHDLNPQDPVYLGNQRALNFKSLNKGVDGLLSYEPKDLPEDFKKRCAHILSRKVEASYWAWKPPVILDAFSKLNEGDILVYLDVGLYPLKDLTPLVNLLSTHDMVVFENDHLNRGYMKRDCLELLNRPLSDLDRLQHQAGLLLMKKSDKMIRFIEKWGRALEDERIVTDNPSKEPEYPNFQGHRHDQAALTCLVYENEEMTSAEKLKISIRPCNEVYKTFHYHRRRSLKEGSLLGED